METSYSCCLASGYCWCGEDPHLPCSMKVLEESYNMTYCCPDFCCLCVLAVSTTLGESRVTEMANAYQVYAVQWKRESSKKGKSVENSGKEGLLACGAGHLVFSL